MSGSPIVQVPAPVGPYTGGPNARISKIDKSGTRTTVASGFPSTQDAMGDLIGVNDVAFIEALVAKIDPGHTRRVYLVGFSNGARLAYRIACDDPSLFNGYAAVKGVPTPNCVLRKPVLLIQLDSVDDPEIPYKPGDGGLEPLPVTTLMAQLHLSEKCPVKSVVTHTQELTMTTWSPCGNGTRLGFAVWKDGKHSFPRPPTSLPAASQVIWSFFTHTPLKPLP